MLVGTELNPWYSCQMIEAALKETMQAQEGVRLANLATLKPTELAAGDALFVSATALLQEAVKTYGDRPVTFFIPVFGDMTMETRLWTRLDQALKGKRVCLLGASTRQCQQLERLTNGAWIRRLPYPLAASWFAPVQQRAEERVRLVYAGRITAQKNVLMLMGTFLKACQVRTGLELHVAGDFHDRGHHFHGYSSDHAEFRRKFFSLMEASEGLIHYHQFLSQEKLLELYDASDVFCSLSTYHDEDFGVSVAQAAARGLQLELSDWGGHWDHATSQGSTLSPVACDSMNVPWAVRQAWLKRLLTLQVDAPGRARRQEIARGMSGAEAFRASLLRLMAATNEGIYRGQSEVFCEYARLSEDVNAFNAGRGEAARRLYLDIYQSYLATESGADERFRI